MDENENIDEMVDEIFGDIDAGSRPREYKHACVRCGDVFTARTEGAKFCPSCRQIMRREAGRKGAEKANGLKTEGQTKTTGAGPRPADADQSGKPADIWAMPGAYDFWRDAFRWKLGFIDFVEAMKGLGITVEGLKKEDARPYGLTRPMERDDG